MKNRKFDMSQREIIVERYNKGENCYDLAKVFNVSPSSIHNIISKLGKIRKLYIAKRTYNVDMEYFKNIDSLEKAYFLGFIIADGTISSSKNEIIICLQKTDKHILEEFKKSIKYEGPIKDVFYKNKNWQDGIKINICCKSLVEDLLKLNCCPNKSFKTTYPDQITREDLDKAFIRGIFDGDGGISLSFRMRKQLCIDCSVTIVGTLSLLNSIKEKIFQISKIKSKIIPIKTNGIYLLYITGYKRSLEFLEWLYNGKYPRLNRKFKRFQFIKRYKRLRSKGIPVETMYRLFIKYKL